MKITKFGHCCLLIEEKGVRVLTDPGSYTTLQNNVKNIDVILITHEHTDHYHIESLRKILENNPGAQIITNNSVSNLLEKEGISSAKIIADKMESEVLGLSFRGFGKDHALIHKEWPVVENTGYFIGDRLFYPGDAFTNPGIPVDILALPLAGPWMKISEAIDAAIKIKPKKYFGVHDGMLNENGGGVIRRVAPQILTKYGIEFIDLEIGKETEF